MMTSRTCWACQSPLMEKQKYCRECEHWQNWRSYFGFSSTVLSLLVALIAVVGAVAPQLAKVTERKFHLIQYVGSYYSGNIEISLINVGSTSTVFSESITCDWFNATLGRNSQSAFIDEPRIIHPGTQSTISYTLDSRIGGFSRNPDEPLLCRTTVFSDGQPYQENFIFLERDMVASSSSDNLEFEKVLQTHFSWVNF